MTTLSKHTNRLIHAASPYLLQHAHNPVDWYEWGDEAITKARKEDKPILVSIGYSSCHWCHVMEHQSFEKEEIAAVMNEHFVCIKVDREERPDIDQIYMDAVQALGVNGGWPLNVFLTPDQKPFFGGTYFAPQNWVQILNNIGNAFKNHRDQIEGSAEELSTHLRRSDIERFKQTPQPTELLHDIDHIYSKLSASFDAQWGGMDREPKFVMPSVWHWLLRYFQITGNPEAIDQIMVTLKRVAAGGIYDQVGGGFARYSVDRHWFAPHFEKMLYDNAQLMSLYSEAYSLTHQDEFKTVVYETLSWLQREMTHPQGGFYSALDADSEGVEGKYYCWTRDELNTLLEDNAPTIATYYSVTEEGNWEHGLNILTRRETDAAFLHRHNISADAWPAMLAQAKHTLLQRRERRIKPGLDDKIITAWNAMMITGLTDAYKVFGDTRFLDAATRAIQFIEQLLTEGNTIYRSFKTKRTHVIGFLDDYAYMIQAYTRLYQVTFNEAWLTRAQTLLEHTLTNFFDTREHYFHYAGNEAETLISRKKEIFDNVIPSSNAIMAQNLHHLGILLDRDDWKQTAHTMTTALAELIRTEPNYMSQWAIVNTELKKQPAEIAIIGPDAESVRHDLQKHFIPTAVYMGTATTSTLPLLKDKVAIQGKTTIYVCFNKTCKLPVTTIPEALTQLTT